MNTFGEFIFRVVFLPAIISYCLAVDYLLITDIKIGLLIIFYCYSIVNLFQSKWIKKVWKEDFAD